MNDRLQRTPRRAGATQMRPPGASMDLEAARDSLQDDLATMHVERTPYDPREAQPHKALPTQQDAAWDEVPGYDAEADMPPVVNADAVTKQILAEAPEKILEEVRPAEAAAQNLSVGVSDVMDAFDWNFDMEQVMDGQVFIGMARFPDAGAGFPQMVSWDGVCFRQSGRRGAVGDVVKCWAWISRDVLPAWPKEPV